MRFLKSRRVVPGLVALAACASFRAPRPQVAPLTPALRRFYGCYTIDFPAAGGVTGAWQLQLDSAMESADGARRWATFVVPKGKWAPPVYWGALSEDSLFVRTMMGREGQGIEVRAAVRGDSLAGNALEHWSLGSDAPRSIGPALGARIPCSP